MGERQQYGPEGWLDLATAGIRFKPDREAVRAQTVRRALDLALECLEGKRESNG